MTRNLKMLGLGLVALLAMSAVVASVGSATDGVSGRFDSEAGTVTQFGTQSNVHELNVAAGKFTCEIATFHGTNTGTKKTSITINPTYQHCTNTLIGAVEVAMNGCDYLFTASSATVGTVHIGPIGCGPIRINRTTGKTGTTSSMNPCETTIPAQTLGGITYESKGSGTTADIHVKANVTGIHYIQHGFFCPGNGFSATKTFTTGTYNGEVTMRGFGAGGEQRGLWVT